MINSVTLAGNLTRDVVTRQTNSGSTAMNFGLALNERKRNAQGVWEESPIFIDCAKFDQSGSAQWMVPYLKKGFHVTVNGKLTMGKWTDKQTGQERSKLELLVYDIDAAWPKKDSQPSYGAQQPQTTNYPQQQQYAPQMASQQATAGYARPVQQQAPPPMPQQQPMPTQQPIPQQQPMPQQQPVPQAVPQQPPAPAQTGMYDPEIPF